MARYLELVRNRASKGKWRMMNPATGVIAEMRIVEGIWHIYMDGERRGVAATIDEASAKAAKLIG